MTSVSSSAFAHGSAEPRRIQARPYDYRVVNRDDAWRLELNGAIAGRYDTQAAAVRAATWRAREAAALGHPASVAVEGDPASPRRFRANRF